MGKWQKVGDCNGKGLLWIFQNPWMNNFSLRLGFTESTFLKKLFLDKLWNFFYPRKLYIISRPGQDQGRLYKQWVILCENILTAPPRHTGWTWCFEFQNRLGYNLPLEILNLERHPYCITGSKVTAILLSEWILPFGGASAVEGLW